MVDVGLSCGVAVADGVDWVSVGSPVYVDVGVTVGVFVLVPVGLGVWVSVGVVEGTGVGASPSTKKRPDTFQIFPINI